MRNLSSVLVISVLIAVIVVTEAKDKDNNTDCTAPATVNNGSGTLKFTINPGQFAGKTCQWLIDGTGKQNLMIFLAVEELILGDNDSLKVTTEDQKTVLYSHNGFLWPGVILLDKTQPKVMVTVVFSGDKFDRKWDVNYVTNVSVANLTSIDSTGSFVFPYYDDGLDLGTIDITLRVQTKDKTKNLLMNLQELELNGGKVSFDFVDKYLSNDTFVDKTKVDFLLSAGQQINVNIKGFKKTKADKPKGIQFNYQLVDSLCTQYMEIPATDLDKADEITVLLPNKTSLQTLSSYKCLNIFEHLNPNAKLLLDFKSFKFLNTRDLLTVLDGIAYDAKTLALVDRQFLDIYWNQLYLYSSANKLWVLFESPEVVVRDTNVANSIRISAVSQGGSFLFDNNTYWTTVGVTDKTKPQLPIVFTFTSDIGYQLVLDFDDNKLLPGNGSQSLLAVYESTFRETDKPLIDLQSNTFPPDIMASNNNELKIVFNQIVSDFKVNVTKVEIGCHSSVAGMANTFAMTGCKTLCSWLIPARENTNGSFVLQFSHMSLTPDVKRVSVEMLGTKTSTVLELKGPLTTTTFPDLWLDSSETYVLYVERTPCDGKSVDASKLLSVSFVYSDEDLSKELIDLSPKAVNESIQTSNYPNFYAVGSDHLWTIDSTDKTTESFALISFIDLDLSPNHKLLLRSENQSERDVSNGKPLSDIPDCVATLPALLNLSSQLISKNISIPFSGRGFKANLTVVKCGGDLVVGPKGEYSITTPKELKGIEKCIWTVNTNSTGSDGLPTLDFEIKAGDGFDDKNLVIYDSKTIRDNVLWIPKYFNTTQKKSSTSGLVVVYTVTDKLIPLTILFNATVCKQPCDTTKRCLLDQFYCNGFNDCGDNSDEIHCNGTAPQPTPTPGPPEYIRTGINGWVVFLVICPISIALGSMGVIYGPQIMSRFGRGRYREFADFSEVS